MSKRHCMYVCLYVCLSTVSSRVFFFTCAHCGLENVGTHRWRRSFWEFQQDCFWINMFLICHKGSYGLSSSPTVLMPETQPWATIGQWDRHLWPGNKIQLLPLFTLLSHASSPEALLALLSPLRQRRGTLWRWRDLLKIEEKISASCPAQFLRIRLLTSSEPGLKLAVCTLSGGGGDKPLPPSKAPKTHPDNLQHAPSTCCDLLINYAIETLLLWKQVPKNYFSGCSDTAPGSQRLG